MIVTVHSNDDTINWNATGNERIVQNVLNILRTRQFEVPFMREFGINPDFLDSAPQSIQTDFLAHITELIEDGEPRASVVDVRIDTCDADGAYIIAVDLEV